MGSAVSGLAAAVKTVAKKAEAMAAAASSCVAVSEDVGGMPASGGANITAKYLTPRPEDASSLPPSAVQMSKGIFETIRLRGWGLSLSSFKHVC